MKQLLWFLAVLGLTASVASAGPNAGGVLWVHDTGVSASTDAITWPAKPADCLAVDTEMPVYNALPGTPVSRYWKVYAAFPAGRSPRLKSVGWRTVFTDNAASAYTYVNVTSGVIPDEDGAGTDFFIAVDGFPLANEGKIGQSFPTGPRTATVNTLFIFGGFGYNAGGAYAPPTWSVAQKVGDDLFGDDQVPANTDKIMGYGTLGFGAAGTAPCPTNDPDAACCAPEGTCTLTKVAACVAPSVWHGDWYVCTPNPCPIPTGACCYPNGTCLTPTESQCNLGGGVYMGNFVLCDPNPCPAPGACCMANGSCLLRTESACAVLIPSGIWHAEWTSCDPNQCPPPPTGACCVSTGACTVTTEAACAMPGIWHAEWTSCDPNPCPQPPADGSCCALDGTCTVTTQANCSAPSTWTAADVCTPNTCPPPPADGSCCALDGTCTVTTQAACAAICGSIWTEAGICESNPCPICPGPRDADDFEDGSVACWTTWSAIGTTDNCMGPGSVLTAEGGVFAQAGGYGLRARRTSAAYVDLAELNTNTWSGPVRLSFDVRPFITTSGSTHSQLFSLSEGSARVSESGSENLGVQFTADGRVFARSPGIPQVGTYTRDQWCHVEINVDPESDLFSLDVNGPGIVTPIHQEVLGCEENLSAVNYFLTHCDQAGPNEFALDNVLLVAGDPISPPPPTSCPVDSTGLPITLLLSGVYLDGVPVEAGDLLCVTDVGQDSLPVGAAPLGGSYPLAVTAWEGDPGYSLPGAVCGDVIGYRLRVGATGATYTDVVAAYTTGDSAFCGEPYTTVTLWFGGNPPSTGFTRGDVDASGELNISDPIYTLTYQFAFGPPPPCLDAADDDDSGEVDISDPIYSLMYQYAFGPPPPAPFPTCGPDPTADAIGCDSFPPCGVKALPAPQVAKVVDGSKRLVLETVPGTSPDSLTLKVTVVTDVPLAGLEGTAGFDPSRLSFIRFVKSGSGSRMNFLSARDAADGPSVRLGCVPDFGLVKLLAPGTYEIGQLVFARRGASAPLDGAVWLTDGRFVGRALQAYRIEGGPVVGPTNPGTPGGGSSTNAVLTTLRVTPNPFVGNTTMYLAGPSATSARVLIFDAAGRLVRTAWEGSLDGREVTITWDGRDQSGRETPAGIYLVRVEGAAVETTGRLVKTQ